MSILLIILGFFSTIVFGILSIVSLVKKNGKVKKRSIGILVSIVLFIIGVSTLGSSDEPVSTTSEQPTTTQTTSPTTSNDETKAPETPEPTPTVDDSKKFNAAVSQTVNGLKINIAEVMIEKDKVSIGMNIENTTKQKLTFYPDQGSIIIGDMQLEANMFMGTGDLSGDINSSVKKDGIIVFTVPEGKELDIQSIKEIKLAFGTVYNEEYTTQDANIVLPVK
jgi:hypothetical protein